jgi:hypothetical protein
LRLPQGGAVLLVTIKCSVVVANYLPVVTAVAGVHSTLVMLWLALIQSFLTVIIASYFKDIQDTKTRCCSEDLN